jgi:hypothetical protein
MEDTMGYLLGLAGLVIGFVLGKMNATNKGVSGDRISGKGIKAGGDVNTGTNVGGNQANDKSKQNN